MTSRTDPRIHFAGRFSTLIDELRGDGGFESLGQLALLCAALGYDQGRKSDRSSAQYDVRFSVMQALPGGEDLINAIALATVELPITKDPLSVESADENLKIFEMYVNGGLEIIAEKTAAGSNPLDEIFRLMNEQIAEITNEGEKEDA